MAHFADCWSHLAGRTTHTVVPPLGAQMSRERCERSRCSWMACMKVSRGRLSCSKVFLSSVSNVNLCVCFFLFCFQRSVYRSIFCLSSCSSVFVCSRASVPLSLFYLSVLVSCSKISILICIFVFWIRCSVLYSFQVRVQVLFFCSDLFRSWFSVSFFLFCSVSLMKVMMGLRMRLNLMSRSRRAGHADLKC